jgi:hypothetical protein
MDANLRETKLFNRRWTQIYADNKDPQITQIIFFKLIAAGGASNVDTRGTLSLVSGMI